MNDSDHTFSISETDQHKLDEVREEIVHPVARRFQRHFRRNPWQVMVLAAATGLLCGLMLRRRG